MVDDSLEQPEEETGVSVPESDDIFNKMASVEPLRVEESDEDEIDSDDDSGHGTLEDRIENSRKLTDLQVADKRLNPDLGYRHLNVLEMSRVFPDSYTPLSIIMENDLIKRGMPVPEAIAYVNTALSIAIDGEGRIDEIVIFKGHMGQAEEERNNKGGLA